MKRRSSSSTWTLVRTAVGFSLIELMVALALSLMLLLGVVAIFSSSRVSYESTEQLSRIQETGRFALDEISRRARSAGFAGCSRQPNFMSSALNNSTALPWRFLPGEIVNGVRSGGAVEGMDGETPQESDTIVLRGARMDFEPIRITQDVTDPQMPLVVERTTGINEGDVVVAYSCEGQSFFQVTGVGATSLAHAVQAPSPDAPGNSFASTNYPFREDAEVVPVETVTYFVGPSPQPAPPAPALPAGTQSLFRRIGVAGAEELVQGVEQMQAEYGVDLDGDRVVDRYDDARDITSWDRVVAVRVTLLVRSLDQYGSDVDQRTYQLPDDVTVVAPGDRRLREIFTATTSIRNRTRTN